MNTQTSEPPGATRAARDADKARNAEEACLACIQLFDQAEKAMLNSAAELADMGGVSRDLRDVYLRGLRITMQMQRDNLVRLLKTSAPKQTKVDSKPTTKGNS